MDDSFEMMLRLAAVRGKEGLKVDARIMVANWLEVPYFQKVYNKIRDLVLEEGQMTRGLAIYQCEKDTQMLEWIRSNLTEESAERIKSVLEGL